MVMALNVCTQLFTGFFSLTYNAALRMTTQFKRGIAVAKREIYATLRAYDFASFQNYVRVP